MWDVFTILDDGNKKYLYYYAQGLFVIDEYPNLILTRGGKRRKTDFSSSLQKAIDLYFKKGNLP